MRQWPGPLFHEYIPTRGSSFSIISVPAFSQLPKAVPCTSPVPSKIRDSKFWRARALETHTLKQGTWFSHLFLSTISQSPLKSPVNGHEQPHPRSLEPTSNSQIVQDRFFVWQSSPAIPTLALGFEGTLRPPRMIHLAGILLSLSQVQTSHDL